MKILNTLLAIAGFALLLTAGPVMIQGTCGKCDTYPSGNIGGNAQIPLRLHNDDNRKIFECTTFDKEVRLSTCNNAVCDLCMFFE